MDKKQKDRLILDDSPGKKDKLKLVAAAIQSKFIFNEVYDPDEPFSEFLFRSFRKDR